MELSSAAFWIALLQIIWVNILLSGDNAVVIALAARSLPPEQQKKAIVIGSAAAIVMRIVLTLVAAKLLMLPYLKLIGAALLVYIGVTLLLPEGDDDGGEKKHSTLMTAIRTIMIADLVMSLDNVVAVAAAAMGDTTLLVVGLAWEVLFAVVRKIEVADLTGGILEAHTQQRSIGLERDDPDHHRTQPRH